MGQNNPGKGDIGKNMDKTRMVMNQKLRLKLGDIVHRSSLQYSLSFLCLTFLIMTGL